MKNGFRKLIFGIMAILLLFFWLHSNSDLQFAQKFKRSTKLELDELFEHLPLYMYDTVVVRGKLKQSFYVPFLGGGYWLESATGKQVFVRARLYPEQEGQEITLKAVVKPGIKTSQIETIYLREIEHVTRPGPFFRII